MRKRARQHPRVSNTILISRHDPHRVSMWHPVRGNVTVLEDIRHTLANGGTNAFRRADIALINLINGAGQALVYATPDGGICGDGVQYLTAEELQWVREEAMLCHVAGQLWSEMKCMTRGY